MKPISRRNLLKKGILGIASFTVASRIMGSLPATANNGSATPLTGSSDADLRFLYVTDTHLDLRKPETVTWMEMLVERINRNFHHADFVVFGGDNFNNNVLGKKDAEIFKKIADRLKCPWYSVRGNKESSPKPETDPLNQEDYKKMFFTSSSIKVSGRDWSLEKGNYTILGIDSTVEHHNNGAFTKESLDFIETQLKNNKDRHFIIVNHHPYLNFWGGKEPADIHKYVLNNADEIKKRLFKYPNLRLTLSGHKHLDNVTKKGDVTVVSTLGFIVSQGAKKDHQFRFVEMKDGNVIHQEVVGIV